MRNKILKTLKGFPECSYKRNMFLKMLVYYEFRETESKSKTLTLFACYHIRNFTGLFRTHSKTIELLGMDRPFYFV